MGPLARLSALGRRSYDEAAAKVADWIRGQRKLNEYMDEYRRANPGETSWPSPVELMQDAPPPLDYSPLQLVGRLDRAAGEAPATFEFFSPQAILEGVGYGRAAAMNPADFERLAAPLGDEPDAWKLRRLQDLLNASLAGNPMFSEMPHLNLRGVETEPRRVPAFNVTGHEGRHRMRTLAGEGVDRALVRLSPSDYGPYRWGPRRESSGVYSSELERRLLGGDAVLFPEDYSLRQLGMELQAQRENPDWTPWGPRPPLRARDIFKSVWRRGGRV